MNLNSLYMGLFGASAAAQGSMWIKASKVIEQNNVSLMFLVSAVSVIAFIVIGVLNYMLKRKMANNTHQKMIDKYVRKMYKNGKSPEEIQEFLDSQDE